ncbi:MAG TPA: hypothetical protein VF665_18485 [Longimicrobium sp.]|jgi:hypothetical protein|uniref:hypothetical protein n=1 Tax=Longimicrobium sp. TaxID=2029185 RepID=UPI002EDB6FE8
MLICNCCDTPIRTGARFCEACGDPVTAGDLVSNRAAPSAREGVQIVCPRCEKQALQTIPSHGVAQITCPACATVFTTAIVRIRAKRSKGQKQRNERSFSVRVEGLNGDERLLEFVRPSYEDFELRSRDLAAFTSLDGRLSIVQNLTIGRSMSLKGNGAGCLVALLVCVLALFLFVALLS